MYYGTRDPFEYWECAACGCLQIERVPHNLADYYRDYYSLHREIKRASHPLERWFRRGRLRRALGHTTHPFWALVERLAPKRPDEWLRRTGVDVDARVLDIGSGRGDRLQALYRQGFRHLQGVDPFLEGDVRYANGVTVYARELEEVGGEFDLVMAHHTLEHMPDQHEALTAMANRLARGGRLLIRIPLKSSYAWRTYRGDWVQLDPPRHLYLHTDHSFRWLAAAHDLAVVDSFHDSTAFQFLGSERYRRDVPLIGQPDEALFSAAERQAFAAQARALNASGDGDQACFVLTPRD